MKPKVTYHARFKPKFLHPPKKPKPIPKEAQWAVDWLDGKFDESD